MKRFPHHLVDHDDLQTRLASVQSSREASPLSSPLVSIPSTPGTEADTLFENPVSSCSSEDYVLVTGGLGFIGSHTVVELLKAGSNVIIIDDTSNSFPDVFRRIQTVANNYFEQWGGCCPKVVFYRMNYRNIPAVRALLEEYHTTEFSAEKRRNKIIGVIHFASFKAVEESIRKPLRYYRNNINGLVDLMSLLQDYNIRKFIYSSSATVYGSLADGGQPLREEQCVHKEEMFENSNGAEVHLVPGIIGITSPYGRTKYFGEAILSDLAESDSSWNIISLRYFNPVGCDASGLLGEDPRGVPSNLLPVVARVLTGQREVLQVYGSDWDTPDGTALRDFIHVSDLARGHIAALAAACSGDVRGGYRTFNVGTGGGHSVLEVVAAMESASGRRVPIHLAGRRAGDVRSSIANTERAERELGWKSRESLLDACRDLWNFLKLKEN